MKTVTLSIIIMAGAAFALPATAQEAPAGGETAGGSYAPVGGTEYSPPTDAGPSIWSDGNYNYPGLEEGLAAMQDNKVGKAEKIFASFLRRNRNDAEGNLYLGVARMDQGKWKQAKRPLEIAEKRLPNHPDPKSRLAVTYAKLGDVAGANALRSDLVQMNNDCKSDCELAPYILAGIEMIDEALAQP